MLLDIREVPATVTPTHAAIIIKYIGKDFARAESASGEILPAKYVSTTLNKVWNKVPTLAGIAIFLKSVPMGSLSRFNDFDNFTSVKFFLEYMLCSSFFSKVYLSLSHSKSFFLIFC